MLTFFCNFFNFGQTTKEVVFIKTKEFINSVLTIGEKMLISGAEIYRVEDSLKRIFYSYGFSQINIFAITSTIIISIKKDDDIFTQTKRITYTDTNLEKLSRLNELSRHICKKNEPVSYIEKELRKIDNCHEYNKKERRIFNFLTAFSFSNIFGGNIYEMIVSGILGIVLIEALRFFKKTHTNNILTLILSTASIGFIASVTSVFIKPIDAQIVAIGDIMLIAPGLMLAGSVRDMFYGDLVAGILRLFEAVCIAFAIAVGFSVAFLFL